MRVTRATLDRLVYGLLAGVAALAVLRGDMGHVTTATTRGEFVELGALIVSALTTLFSFFRGHPSSSSAQILGLRDTVTALGKSQAELAAKTGGWFQSFLGIFQSLWGHGLRPLITNVYNWLKRLQAQLGKWFAPVLRWLKTIRADVLKIYQKWIRPILDTIDIVRRALQLFALFGWDDAKKLEQKLATLEDKITEPFLIAIRKINEIVGWVDLIITGDGLFQKLALYRSLLSYRRSVVGILSRGLYTPVSEPAMLKYTTQPIVKTPEMYSGELAGSVRNDGGHLNAQATEYAAILASLLRA